MALPFPFPVSMADIPNSEEITPFVWQSEETGNGEISGSSSTSAISDSILFWQRTSAFSGQLAGRAKDKKESELEHPIMKFQVWEERNFLAQSKCAGDNSITVKKAAQSAGMFVVCTGPPMGEKCLAQSL
jgi:hypothetical protein